ncbi:CPBP family intramembrane glutamic endopeptidase [Actibacterium pelagium]|nr:CPBP family intramembrane glutamic endopeptidase [Actibacterium pelagium]
MPRRVQLWAEFLGLFIVAPIIMAVFLPPERMFTVLGLVMVLGVILLHRTPGFEWGQLKTGARNIDWRMTRTLTAAVVAFSLVVMYLTAPGDLFQILRWRPELLVMIWIFYPIMSALPQELIYRPLFFRRYGELLPSPKLALVLNAAIFSFAHLMYWNWIVAFMTFCGGLVFAWSYEKQRNFPQAVLQHAIAGNLLFLIGMGVYFYSGNVTRPF